MPIRPVEQVLLETLDDLRAETSEYLEVPEVERELFRSKYARPLMRVGWFAAFTTGLVLINLFTHRVEQSFDNHLLQGRSLVIGTSVFEALSGAILAACTAEIFLADIWHALLFGNITLVLSRRFGRKRT